MVDKKQELIELVVKEQEAVMRCGTTSPHTEALIYAVSEIKRLEMQVGELIQETVKQDEVNTKLCNEYVKSIDTLSDMVNRVEEENKKLVDMVGRVIAFTEDQPEILTCSDCMDTENFINIICAMKQLLKELGEGDENISSS